ncbi:MAG: immune inhibitor A [candidate division WOR-3 bacterium]|nr:immune inhibitor A [candidate division WOR-3 bacterium]MDW8113978.1 immune inhibitor A [candidate division WOR-3 bacterium]
MYKSRRNKNIYSLPKKLALNKRNIDTIRVLAIRVEFKEDNDTLTTGNGKMDLKGFLTEEDGLYYDPPHTKKYFENLLLGLRNYFWHNSLGKLHIEFKVMPEGVLDAYQLPYEMKYYGDTMWKWPNYDFRGVEMGLCRLMEDAFTIADQDTNINFSDYDYFIIFHAGSCAQTDIKENSPFDLWAATINSEALEYYLGKPYIEVDNGKKRIDIACILPEMTRQDTLYEGGINYYGMMGMLGLLAHEFVHPLGGYDLYDVTGHSMGVGGWSLMGYGGWLGSHDCPPGTIPSSLDPFHKILFGFVEPKVVNLSTNNLACFTMCMDSLLFSERETLTFIYKIPISEDEYFLIENRQTDIRKKDTIVVKRENGVVIGVEDGEYDFFLAGSGILIWHIDEKIIREYGPYNAININPSHKGVDLVEADGIQDFDKFIYQDYYEMVGSKYDPFFKGGFLDSLTENTSPSSDGYYGKTYYQFYIHSEPETIMYFSFKNKLLKKELIRNFSEPLLSPLGKDLNCDGIKEVIVPCSTGIIYAYEPNGEPYLGYEILCQLPLEITSDLSIGDITGDSMLEIVVISYERIVVIDAFGNVLFDLFLNGEIKSEVLLYDIDNNNKKEIIVGTEKGYLYIINGEGRIKENFPIKLIGKIKLTPAICDSYIVILTDNNQLHLVSFEGRMKNGFPISLSYSPFSSPSSPIVFDFDNDKNKEILLLVPINLNYKLFIISPEGDIKYSSKEIMEYPAFSYIAIGDVNNDKNYDIITFSKNKIFAFNYNLTLIENFPIIFDSIYLKEIILNGYLFYEEIPFYFYTSPIIGDFDGNEICDIFAGLPNFGVSINNQQRLFTTGGIKTVPFITDLDNDSLIELILTTEDRYLYVYNTFGKEKDIFWQTKLSTTERDGRILKKLEKEAISNKSLINYFYVYPNPITINDQRGYLRFKTTKEAIEAKIEIYDFSFKKLLERKIKNIKVIDNEYEIDIKKFKSGVYLLKLEISFSDTKEVRYYKFGIVK